MSFLKEKDLDQMLEYAKKKYSLMEPSCAREEKVMKEGMRRATEATKLAKLGLSILEKEGPRGPDRRWKVACELACGRSFDTPMELIDFVSNLKSGAFG